MAASIQKQLSGFADKMNEKNPYYLLLLLLSAILLGLYFFPIQYQFASLQTLIPKVRDLGQDLQNSQNNIQRLAQYEKELAGLKAKYARINKKIKMKEELPMLLETISRIASKNNVRIEQVMPQTTVQEPVLDNADGKYFLVPIMIEARSGYHDFGRFLNQLEQEGIFSDLADLTMAADVADTNHHLTRLTLKSILLEKKGK